MTWLMILKSSLNQHESVVFKETELNDIPAESEKANVVRLEDCYQH